MIRHLASGSSASLVSQALSSSDSFVLLYKHVARRRTRFASLSGALLNKSRDLNTRLQIQNHSLITILAGSRNANSYVGEPTGDKTMHSTSLQ